MSAATASAVKLSDFAARPAVQRALKTSPHTTESVLSFFFGVDYQNPNEIEQDLRQGNSLHSMSNLWYAGGPEYDALCGSFQQAVRHAGRGLLLEADTTTTTLPPYLTPVDQVVALMILCDQLSRNIFRGTAEAFAYEDQALLASRQITDSVLKSPPVLDGEVYPPYLSFSITALIHSESIQDHEQALEVLNFALTHKSNTSEQLKQNWEIQKQFALDHKAVVERFGRYPHRNTCKGRTSTPEEEAWLADVDNLPGWAKSQM